MPQVVFSYKKIMEKKYLNQLLKEKTWFESEGFDAFLPKNKDLIEKEIIEKSSPLNKKITQLSNGWKKIEKGYFEVVKEFGGKELRSIYNCHVSRFGPEGKYMPPNTLFVRLRTKQDRQIAVETVGHELLHLLFADIFKSKKLDYAEREGVIDALMLQSDLANIFPNYRKQSIGRVRKKLLGYILYNI